MKKIFFILFATFLMPFILKAEWVSVDKTKSSKIPPSVKIISDDMNSTVIKIEIAGFDLNEFMQENKSYQAVDLLTEVFTADPGNPELPYIAKVLAVPDHAGISIEVIESGEVQIFKNITLPPARQNWWEGQPKPVYEENAKAYQSEEVFPNEFVKVDPPGVFRDFRIARVSVYPLRYIPAKKELQAVSSITVRLNYGKGEVINPKTTVKKEIAPSFGKLYRSFIFNYQNVLDNLYNGKEAGHELMLCIMPDEFVASFQIYADWKRQSGTDIHVTKFSDIGANASNPDIIKTHIADAYHNWDVPPTYVLIIGDDGVFPKKIVTYPDYSFPNEDFFVEIDGNDYFPEMMIGRFTNQGDYRMQVMINKFMLYEKTPYTTNTDWFKKGVVCANNEFISQVETKRFTANLMLEAGGFTSVDTLMSDADPWGGGCTIDLSDVLNVLNNGRSYLNYRGEGWYYGWYANCYDFSTSDVSNLNNDQKFTFVTSIGCGVAMFDAPGGNCFGEEWVEMGSLTSPRGGIAFIGPTSNTHTTNNNKIDKGIYVGMFNEGLDTPGQALLRGKFYMYSIFGNDYYVAYHYKIYCVLGDPSLHVWKDVPQVVNVSYPASIPVGNHQVDFNITFASNGQPVANAEVCVTGEDVFVTGFSDETGTATLDFIPLSAENLTVTVRGGNVIPFQGSMNVIPSDIYIEPEGEPVITELDGNSDGLVNPNEHCSITFTLKNWGIQTANNVQATLSTENNDVVEIINANVNFGNISPSSTFTGNPFQFFVKPICPIGEIISLQLHITSTSYTWDYNYEVEVMGCEISYENFIVYDGGEGNLNFRMDPGETVVVVLSIKNFGNDLAPDVMGILQTSNPYITIVDSIGSFGELAVNGISKNLNNCYIVQVDPACPTGYLVDYTLKTYTQNGNYPYMEYLYFQMPVSLPIPADYTGPDNYGYYAYSSDDSFYEQTPEYDWIEIDGIGTQLNLPLVSDYTQTVNLPFTFKYYGQDFNQIRVSTDGWMAFGSGTQIAPINYPLPHTDNISSMVAVFWDDLYDHDFFLGDIIYYNDAENHRFIIEWDSIAQNNILIEIVKENFQVILLNPQYYPTSTGDGEIIMQYKKVEAPETNTIGIENFAQNIGLQYVFDNNYDPTASALGNESAIKFTTEPPFTTIITSLEENADAGKISDGSRLGQNKPNPFISRTRIDYSLAQASNVTLKIYNVDGALIRILQNGQQSAGNYSVEWNGLNSEGNLVGPGIYFYRLQTEDYLGTMKMFMMK
jgi:hypothetical protein